MGGWDEGGGGELLTALDFTRENLTLFCWTQAPARELISHTCLASLRSQGPQQPICDWLLQRLIQEGRQQAEGRCHLSPHS